MRSNSALVLIDGMAHHWWHCSTHRGSNVLAECAWQSAQQPRLCVPGVQWGCGHCSGSVRRILALAGRAGRCKQLLRQWSHSSWPCLRTNSSGEVAGGKALPCSLDVFLKAQGQSESHQLRSRAKEVTSLFETRISFTALGTKPCSSQAHRWWLLWMGRWCHRSCCSLEMELHLCLVPLELCKCL